ncbi:hypothetical protein E8E14_008173 [Neopestalotiopsis sp. 37M]|nr:hypothetical protein E8E14_008173 [Neopestalotiopsis sp. 37M]
MATCASPTSTTSETQKTSNSVPIIAQRDMQAGASCSNEGQWYCMGTSWQRCAAGQWSVVIQCAENTQCTPSGLSYDFAVEYKGAGNGASTSGASVSRGSSTRSWDATVMGRHTSALGIEAVIFAMTAYFLAV